MWSSLTKDLTEFAQTVAASSAEVLAQIAPVDLSENHNAQLDERHPIDFPLTLIPGLSQHTIFKSQTTLKNTPSF